MEYSISLYTPRKGTLTLPCSYDNLSSARSAAVSHMEGYGYDQATIWVEDPELHLPNVVEVFEI